MIQSATNRTTCYQCHEGFGRMSTGKQSTLLLIKSKTTAQTARAILEPMPLLETVGLVKLHM